MNTPTFAPITVPAAVEAALGRGAALVVSISGGKDSQAMLNVLVDLHRTRGWTGPIVALHADLGRVEWQGDPSIPGFRSAPEHVEAMCQTAGVPLHIVRRSDGRDMIDHWQARAEQTKGTGVPFWSSSAARYCTSDMKRDPMNVWVRNTFKVGEVIVCEGLRAQESPERAKKARLERRTKCSSRKRQAWTWRPIFDWTQLQVWRAIGTSWGDLRDRRERWAAGDRTALVDWPAAPAYVLGNERLSCAMCVLAPKPSAEHPDLVNGARYNPSTWAAMVDLERTYGYTFRLDISLEQIGQLAGLVPTTTLEQAA